MNLVRGEQPKDGEPINLHADEGRRKAAAAILVNVDTTQIYDMDIAEHRMWRAGLLAPDSRTLDEWPELMPGPDPQRTIPVGRVALK